MKPAQGDADEFTIRGTILINITIRRTQHMESQFAPSRMISGEHPLSVLLVSNHPEEIRLVTTTLRGFFTQCRIEAVYTAKDALRSAGERDWHLFIIDEEIMPHGGTHIVADVKRSSPHAAVILQTNHSDAASAIAALRQGADFLLFKSSPGFLTELLFSAQEAIEKRELEKALERIHQCHLRLIENVDGIVYELDESGRFIYVSPSITSLLGYTLNELAGQHFSILLPPAQKHPAHHLISERRTGRRAVHQHEVLVRGKSTAGRQQPQMLMRLNAKGLYDEHRRYLGSVGVLQKAREPEPCPRIQARENRSAALHFPVKLTIGTTAWPSKAIHGGAGGMLIAVGPEVPFIIGSQPMYLVLRTPVSFLELQGTAQERSVDHKTEADRQIALEFSSLSHTDAAIFSSFLQGIEERFADITIEVLIPESGGR